VATKVPAANGLRKSTLSSHNLADVPAQKPRTIIPFPALFDVFDTIQVVLHSAGLECEVFHAAEMFVL
jgi:hypothetical protein